MIIAVDFDGTCVDHRFPEPNPPSVPYAAPVMRELVKQGHKLILNTCRSGGMHLEEAIHWFKRNGIILYAVGLDPRQNEWTDSRKCFANVYIDDAGFGCPKMHVPGFKRPCVNWEVVADKLLENAERDVNWSDLKPSEVLNPYPGGLPEYMDMQNPNTGHEEDNGDTRKIRKAHRQE